MEMLMQYLWQHKLQLRPGMTTTDGCPVEIIDPGRLNTDSGPDFFNATVKLGPQVWVGNVEIHVKASDWYRHGHDSDRAYDSVILHVVAQDDAVVSCDGRVLPQLLLPCTREAVDSYMRLKGNSPLQLPCAATVRELSPLHRNDWITSLAYERVGDKAARLEQLSSLLGGDWEEVAYITLARALGFSVNSDPFERLARALPLRYIRKHADNLLLVEAMLMGQSGLLATAPAANEYAAMLRGEYDFMAFKFDLKPPGIQWKLMRMRPAGHPLRRIALLARILCNRDTLLSRILDITTVKQAQELFNSSLSGYWSKHFTFNDDAAASCSIPRALSRMSVVSLIINVVVPLQYTRALAMGDDALMDRAMELLESLPPEVNRLTVMFADAGIVPENALESQALVQLRRSYCEQRKCLYCRFGHYKIKSVCKAL